MNTQETNPHRTLQAAAGLTVLVVLFVVSRYNYLLFHGLTELFSIAVAWSVFLLVWNTRRISSSDALLFVGIAYLFVGFIDLIHTLVYKGMGVFPDSLASNQATQLWIAARGIEAVALLLFPLLLGRRIRPWPVLLGYAGVTAFLLAAIFAWGIFPTCYIEGAGLTGVKVGAEWVICAMLVLAIGLLLKRREFLDATVWTLLIAAMAVTIAGELAFTLYTDVYGLSNVVGHLLKIVSFFLVYLALVRSTVARPLATVFRGTEQKKQMLAEEGRHLRLLHKTASLFLELETLDDTIGALPELIADHYAVPIVAIELYEADRQEMVFAGSVGIPKAEDGPLSVPVDQTISGTVATSGRAVIELNVSERADYRAEALRELGVVTFACVPLIGQEGIIGTLAVADREERPHIVGGADLLQALANNLTQEFERRRQKEQQRESEEKYRHLYETMTQGVVIQDAAATIVAANRAASEILGLTREQLLGKTAYDPGWKLIREDGSPYDPSEMPSNIALRTGKTVENVTCGIYVPEKDEHRWIIIGSSPQFRGSETKPSLTMTVFTDITERKQHEEERKKLEAQLNQAQKMEAIGTFAGGIAHDFNNVLAAMLGYAEMAREDVPPDSTVAKDLDKVLEGGNRAKDLVQQILAFSRQNEMKRLPLQPVSVVKEALKMLRPSLPTTIEINQDIASATGLILADPTQIHQILMNLCTNAFHAMERTGGKLGISLKEVTLSTEDLVHEPSVEPGTFVQLSISDSGPGIPSDIKKKIFDPYFTTKEPGKGTGMGLAIVHGIVKSYGGFISLYSEPGEGTAFHVFIPVIEKELLPEIEDIEPIPVGRDRILFIDDEEILAEMGKSMLERLGYHVTVRNNSIEALKTFQNQPDLFDLVITDQTMPGMTGADIARRMIQIRPDIPIILCTGYSTTMSEEKAKSMGIKEFALKPLSKKDIAVLIRKVLDN